ncbi:hypothetical protein FD12_GL002227 [Lentilactobacillus rapi DSM 19907 = JCM 15042]|uniref:Uncharacterized protein n=3 Tax=Lactobacillaceae TaxID=33958 RepID=A0A512PKD5_9LACO|nr:hypothetical protein FD12_GL002227 [Lentilactobacillus rapi DSM 19907 = JCM 15042]GEP71642.1 hypothetical protein LRA02_05100 [Lentilactobacillus rapi]
MYKESLSTMLKYRDMACVHYVIKEIIPEMLAENFTTQDKLRNLTRKVLKKEHVSSN